MAFWFGFNKTKRAKQPKPLNSRWRLRKLALVTSIIVSVIGASAAGYLIAFKPDVARWIQAQSTLTWRAGVEKIRVTTGITANESEIEELRMGVVWSGPEQGLLVEGATLAGQKINDNGGILGRKLVLDVIADGGIASTSAAATEIAKTLVSNDDIIAAVGHSPNKGAVISSITYEEAGVLFINPFVTDQAVTKHGFTHTFSTIPNDETIGKQIATFTEGLGLRRIGLLNSRENWAFTTVDGFIQQGVTLGLEIVERRSFFSQRQEFLDLIAEFAANEFDAILIVADEETTHRIIKQSIELQVNTVFLVGRLINPDQMNDVIGEVAQVAILPILFDPTSQRPEIMAFREAFEQTFDQVPDSWAAQGYDAIDMLASAINEAGTVNALSVASIMRYTLSWRGLTGRHSFDQLGQIYTKQLGFVTIEQGRLTYSAQVD